jgi:hypothetical protein
MKPPPDDALDHELMGRWAGATTALLRASLRAATTGRSVSPTACRARATRLRTKRKLVRKAISGAMPRVRQQLAALEKGRAALAEEMVKPMPDSCALERGFAAVRLHTMEIGGALQQATMRALPALTQEERRALARALARRQGAGGLL